MVRATAAMLVPGSMMEPMMTAVMFVVVPSAMMTFVAVMPMTSAVPMMVQIAMMVSQPVSVVMNVMPVP